MQGDVVPSVKMDPDTKSENEWMKEESDLMDIAPALQADDDIYEDAGDLDFAVASQRLYLTRLPKMMWENWSQLDDDQEIILGKVRVEGDLDTVKRMSLMLDSQVAERSILPQEYVLEITNPMAANTFVFSEKDFPGYTTKLRSTTKIEEGLTNPLAQRSTFEDRSRHVHHSIQKNRKNQGRRGVPKQTALTGRVQKELKCLPVDNQVFRRMMDYRAKREKEKKTTGFEKGIVSTSVGAVALGPGSSFETFIKTNKPGKKSQKLKAARMPENELRDAIFKCFKRFEFWPMKSLIHDIRQPEVYLKQNLEKVAHLVRSGPRSGNWQLKPEHRLQGYEDTPQEQAPEVASPRVSDIEVDDMDDENVEMEDVPIQ